jgi:adenylylsulfate kinase-like enzyme/SAM-dependent methyltransferase
LTGKVLWITGLSGAGKTTVASILAERLRRVGMTVVLLDGDQVRAALGSKWGYTAADRHDLAFVYARLARLIAESGAHVICATIAMFDDVRAWNRANQTDYHEVFLRAPLDVLVERDQKGLYRKFLHVDDPESVLSTEFQLPKQPDLIIDNFGATSPPDAARMVFERVFSGQFTSAQQADASSTAPLRSSIVDYWNRYYAARLAPQEPTPFARFCKERFIEDGRYLFEIGCGNGRDALYFARTNPVYAIDASSEAIAQNERRAAEFGLTDMTFAVGFYGEFIPRLARPPEYVYARFVLHAIDEVYQRSILAGAYATLAPGGLLLTEFRTVKDPLARQGMSIGVNERVTDHYRRFIDINALCEQLSRLGFEIVYSVESQGLAVHKEEDPVVGRVVARK